MTALILGAMALLAWILGLVALVVVANRAVDLVELLEERRMVDLRSRDTLEPRLKKLEDGQAALSLMAAQRGMPRRMP